VVSAGICGEDEVRGNSERIYKEMIGGLLAIFVIFAAAPHVLAQDRNSSGPEVWIFDRIENVGGLPTTVQAL
jgi:hypothetical protein